MDLEYWATTDVGRVRDHNEDNFLVDKRLHLFVVCDGMGGHAAGEVASAMAVQIVREVLRSHQEVFDRLEQDPESLANRKSVLTLVEHAITEACSRIYHAAQEDLAKKGMGTTCSLLLLAQGRGFIGHVGDSRIYLYRQKSVHQVTEDHSLVNEMLRLGKIKKGEEHNLPHRNAVTRAVGVNESVEVDSWELDVFKGDSFLLCSDGLSGYFKEDAQIAALIDQDDLRKVTQDCIDFANAGGGKDNITAVLVRVKGAHKNSENLQRKMEVMRSSPFFRYLGYKDLVQVLNLSETTHFAAGEWLFEGGTDPGSMYLVVEGHVGVGGRDGQRLGPGEVIGEMAMMDETPHDVGVCAVEDVTLIAIQRNRFMGLLRSDEGLAVKLLWNFLQVLTHRLRTGAAAQTPPGPQGLKQGGYNDATPPSGTLVFDADRRAEADAASRDFVDPDATMMLDEELLHQEVQTDEVDTLPPSSPPGEEERLAQLKARLRRTTPEPSRPRNLDREAMMKTIPSGSFTFNLEPAGQAPADAEEESWDQIVPPDLLPDDLRKTSQIDEEELRATTQMEATDRASIGPAISGVSSTDSGVPGAQVLKRTKLVVGNGSGEFDTASDTRSDVRPIARDKRSDSTLELDIDDDHVEELN